MWAESASELTTGHPLVISPVAASMIVSLGRAGTKGSAGSRCRTSSL